MAIYLNVPIRYYLSDTVDINAISSRL